MVDKEHLAILRQGVAAWNTWRRDNPKIIPDLAEAYLTEINLRKADLSRANLGGAILCEANLKGANLSEVNLRNAIFEWANLSGAILARANLSEVNLSGAILTRANLSEANLSGAILARANLSEVNLSGTNLTRAILSEANLSRANLSRAELSAAILARANLSEVNLSGAILIMADLSGADLSGAYLSRANLIGANLTRANLNEANLAYAIIGWSTLGNLNLATAKGLDTVRHYGPSTIGIDVIRQSKGRIPPEFLRGCGMLPWEIELARLYDPALAPGQIADIFARDIFTKRTDGPLYLGGIFISYSHADSKFVDKLHKQLIDSGANVWLDRHDMLAGDMGKQVARAIRINDIVIVVLSRDSVESDWVEHELEMARDKEKEEKRDVLCPVAVDDSWKQKVKANVLWRQLKKKHILDFSKWKLKEFSPQFNKLLNGLKLNYERKIVSRPIAEE